MNDESQERELAQITVTEGGWFQASKRWLTPKQIKDAQGRWSKRSYALGVIEDGWIPNQCGGCKYFAATGADFGICWNASSPLDGCVTFEHGGCNRHSMIAGFNQPSALGIQPKPPKVKE